MKPRDALFLAIHQHRPHLSTLRLTPPPPQQLHLTPTHHTTTNIVQSAATQRPQSQPTPRALNKLAHSSRIHPCILAICCPPRYCIVDHAYFVSKYPVLG